jgi:hypothetical protein
MDPTHRSDEEKELSLAKLLELKVAVSRVLSADKNGSVICHL